MGISNQELEAHLSQDGVVEWRQLSDVMTSGYLSCVDGRDHGSVVGTPGGDSGELLSVLAAAEAEFGLSFSEADVATICDAYMAHAGRPFYLHTDDGAMGRLATAVGGSAVASMIGDASVGVAFGEALERVVRSGGDELQEALLPFLLEPAHVGCGHLKLILSYPEDYGVRVELTRAFLTWAFRAMWSGANIQYVVLPGAHAEEAVVQVSPATGASGVPAVTPCAHQRQVFVQHPEVVSAFRDDMVAFFVAQQGMSADQATTLRASVDTLTGKQLGETLTHLAKGLPVYQAAVGADGLTVGGGATV
ncbi:MAG: hypothetical protein ACON4N_05655 [Myxococcota bacterium]